MPPPFRVGLEVSKIGETKKGIPPAVDHADAFEEAVLITRTLQD
jgi:hypothetical protein